MVISEQIILKLFIIYLFVYLFISDRGNKTQSQMMSTQHQHQGTASSGSISSVLFSSVQSIHHQPPYDLRRKLSNSSPTYESANLQLPTTNNSNNQSTSNSTSTSSQTQHSPSTSYSTSSSSSSPSYSISSHSTHHLTNGACCSHAMVAAARKRPRRSHASAYPNATEGQLNEINEKNLIIFLSVK